MSLAPASGSALGSSLFSSPLGIGAGIGALGVGALLAEGPGSVPSQFGQLTNNVPFLQGTAQTDIGQGQQLVGQGTQALQMAQNGQLTAPQAAQLQQYQSGLTNQSEQMYYSMGMDPGKSTGFVTQTANVDSQVNAMAQQDIQSTIQIGFGCMGQHANAFAGGRIHHRFVLSAVFRRPFAANEKLQICVVLGHFIACSLYGISTEDRGAAP